MTPTIVCIDIENNGSIDHNLYKTCIYKKLGMHNSIHYIYTYDFITTNIYNILHIYIYIQITIF